jgi:hypothetical protein
MSLSRLDVLRPLREDDAEAVAKLFAADNWVVTL